MRQSILFYDGDVEIYQPINLSELLSEVLQHQIVEHLRGQSKHETQFSS